MIIKNFPKKIVLMNKEAYLAPTTRNNSFIPEFYH
jgi:hypothetical protein